MYQRVVEKKLNETPKSYKKNDGIKSCLFAAAAKKM